MCDIPFAGQHEVVVADLLEVQLLPHISIDECDVVLRELLLRIHR